MYDLETVAVSGTTGLETGINFDIAASSLVS